MRSRDEISRSLSSNDLLIKVALPVPHSRRLLLTGKLTPIGSQRHRTQRAETKFSQRADEHQVLLSAVKIIIISTLWFGRRRRRRGLEASYLPHDAHNMMKRLLLNHSSATRVSSSCLLRFGGSAARSLAASSIPTTTAPPAPPSSSRNYRIQVSNAERRDATKLTVQGPDADGILASMTLALTREGCSVVELHAGTANPVSLKEPDLLASRTVTDDGKHIEDVFFVVDRATGQPFGDHQLRTLAEALWQSLRSPLPTVLSGSSSAANDGTPPPPPSHASDNETTTTPPMIQVIPTLQMPASSSKK